MSTASPVPPFVVPDTLNVSSGSVTWFHSRSAPSAGTFTLEVVIAAA